jgi:hypothetical protein
MMHTLIRRAFRVSLPAVSAGRLLRILGLPGPCRGRPVAGPWQAAGAVTRADDRAARRPRQPALLALGPPRQADRSAPLVAATPADHRY